MIEQVDVFIYNGKKMSTNAGISDVNKYVLLFMLEIIL